MIFAILAGIGQLAGAYLSYTSSMDAAEFAADSSRSAAKQAKYNAEHDAEVQRNQAEQERLNRAATASEEERQARHRRAKIEAMYAKSGVLLEGSPEYMLGEQATVDTMGIDQRNSESLQRQRNLMVGAQNTLIQGNFEADMMKSQGKAQAKAYRYQAYGALLGGVGGSAGSVGGGMAKAQAAGGG
jgi:hypothetical protein